MTNLIHLIDGAIYLLPVIAAVGFLATVALRSLRRFA
jgi:hypothetical protein